MLYFVAFLFGLCVGSFSNVVLARLDRKAGIISGRSECPRCHKDLKWYDLVPLASFVVLGGRCRYCRKPISAWYPAVELLFGVTAVVFVRQYGVSLDPRLIVQAIFLWGFLLLALFDLKYFILPDKLTLPFAALALVVALFLNPNPGQYVLSGFLLAGFFAILNLASRGRWMGLGDAKLGLFIGFTFGYPATLLIALFAVWSGALVGLGLMFSGRATMKTALPFGTFLALVSVIFIIFNSELSILNSYF